MKKANKTVLSIVILIIAFICLSILIIADKTIPLDKSIINYILSIRNDFLTKFFKIITNCCSTYFLIGICLGIYITNKNKKSSYLIIINLILSFLLNTIVKLLLHRPRPEIMLISAKGYSYPSGHSMVGLAFYIFICYLILYNNKNNQFKKILLLILPIIIILVGFSRIYLGVHYFTDVIGGYLLATIYLLVYILILKKKGIIKK